MRTLSAVSTACLNKVRTFFEEEEDGICCLHKRREKRMTNPRIIVWIDLILLKKKKLPCGESNPGRCGESTES